MTPQEIRKFLIESISDTGGHLASNLGVVELTLALHTVFETPRDKIIWDVGHQAYVHKILTGRSGRFGDLRKMDGLSGFPKPCESEHDAFATGHSSTAISAALGLAVARDAAGEKNAVIAVVGDGSLTGGLAYEGLNNAGRSDTDLLVVLNDNQMSISKNVGAVAKHLSSLRTTSAYLGAKGGVHYVLDKLPGIGAPVTRAIERTKEKIKYALLPGVLFEEMGFKYIGPVDGHDISALVEVLRRGRKLRGPVLLHVVTKKGKGYEVAEERPQNFHGVGKFDVETGRPEGSRAEPTYTDIFAKYIVKKALRDKKIVAITAAMPDGVGLRRFMERFPKRFFDVGIAESHAVTFAAGLAKGGLKPVVAVYSSFLQRAYDQIIHDAAVSNLPVVFAIDHAGAVDGDGETHQGIYDIAFLSHIPGITILAPSNGNDLQEMFDFALAHNGPVAIRYPKDIAARQSVPAAENAPAENGFSEAVNRPMSGVKGACPLAGVRGQRPRELDFPSGHETKTYTIRETTPPIHAKQLQDGEKIAIVSVGVMLETAKAVADKLTRDGFSPAVFDSRIVKPVCPQLTRSLAKFAYVFTIEDGARIGGFGEQIRATHAFAFPDVFPATGTRKQLFARHSLDAENIHKKILEVLENGERNQKAKEPAD